MIAVATWLRGKIAPCGKSQIQIAQEAGLSRSNVISMMKSGTTRVPLARVPELASAIGVEPKDLMTRCLSEYQPDLLAALRKVYGPCIGHPPAEELQV